MKYRFLSLLLALCLLLGICGCSGAAQSSSAGERVTTTGTVPASDVDTLSVGAVILARDNVPEQEVYDFLSTVFDHREELAKKHPLGASLDLDYAASVTDVPYHPGAARYFSEQGYDVPAKEGAGAGETIDLSMGTGNNEGNYYTFGSAIAQLFDSPSSFTVTPVTSGGSKANIEDLEAGTVQLCFVQADILSYAYHGERLFQEPLQNFSVVAALYTEQLQIITNDPDITTVDQLRGKRVSIGVSGSGVYYNALDVLSAYDLTLSDFTPVHQAFGDSANSLREGSIDAAFIVAGVPTPAVASLVEGGQISMVSMDREHIAAMMASNPFYSESTIAALSY